jgi:hypothetical protein
MNGRVKAVFVLLVVVISATALSACGSGSSSTSATNTTSSSERNGDPHSSGFSKESKEFARPGGDNNIQEFGDEGSLVEREAASTELRAFMQARAEGDWFTECAHLAPREIAVLHELAKEDPQLKGKDCPAMVAVIASRAPSSTRADSMSGPIDSFRQEGGQRAYALYHGARGIDYSIPMLNHYGEWTVAALEPTPFP